MIISASRRTDIPSFYGDWFFNRVRAGFFLVRNPMNYHQVSRVEFAPHTTECIVFWTKYPAPDFVQNLSQLSEHGYPYYFQFTLTPYGRDIEASLPPKTEVLRAFVDLSKQIGRERLVWRYDPILLTDTYTAEFHINAFESFAQKLSPYTDTCVISFVDRYKKIQSRMENARVKELSLSIEQMMYLASEIAQIAKKYGIDVEACCESIDFTKAGIKGAHCIDGDRINRMTGKNYAFTADKNQRTACGCVQSVDLGAYNTCQNGCVYCYANTRFGAPAPYDAQSPILCGALTDSDKITVRKQVATRQSDATLFTEAR